MKNIEIKKEIEKSIQYVDSYKINLTLYHGDGTLKEINAIYNTLTVWDTKENEIKLDIKFGTNDLTETKENLKVLKTEQKKIFNYLKKHFENITTNEEEIIVSYNEDLKRCIEELIYIIKNNSNLTLDDLLDNPIYPNNEELYNEFIDELGFDELGFLRYLMKRSECLDDVYNYELNKWIIILK